jgi:hypothetical protein
MRHRFAARTPRSAFVGFLCHFLSYLPRATCLRVSVPLHIHGSN